MKQLTDKIYVGDSTDELGFYTEVLKINAILNVAFDMPRRHPEIKDLDYIHIGLQDGPGNPPALYYSAVIALYAALEKYNKVMVCCHSGSSRSLAVVMMYNILKAGRVSKHPTFPNVWKTWQAELTDLRVNNPDLSDPHAAHREMCDRMCFALLEQLLQ